MKPNLSMLALAGLVAGSLAATSCASSPSTPDTSKQAMEGAHECGSKDSCKGANGCPSAEANHDCSGKDSCKGAESVEGTEHEDEGAEHKDMDSDVAKHDGAGKNACKGMGGCKVDAKKLVELSTAAGVDKANAGQPHDCAGKNACKGLGGCNVDGVKADVIKENQPHKH